MANLMSTTSQCQCLCYTPHEVPRRVSPYIKHTRINRPRPRSIKLRAETDEKFTAHAPQVHGLLPRGEERELALPLRKVRDLLRRWTCSSAGSRASAQSQAHHDTPVAGQARLLLVPAHQGPRRRHRQELLVPVGHHRHGHGAQGAQGSPK